MAIELTSVLSTEELASIRLRQLYQQAGYSRFRMSKFEEYDLYARNKDFLVSGDIITFTDTNGKLMALKPDVTLSIVKNVCPAQGDTARVPLQKLCYAENVYRVSRDTRAFREIMQTGIECIGEVDEKCVIEAISLAAQSLQVLSERFVLDISHLGLVSELLDSCKVPAQVRPAVLRAIEKKSAPELARACAQAGVSADDSQVFLQLLALYGPLGTVLPQLETLVKDRVSAETWSAFVQVASDLASSEFAPQLRMNFSTVSDMTYYDGFVFKGFIEGAPSSVVSGGQYNKLLRAMGKQGAAIGFAVYLDVIERMVPETCAEGGFCA